jgi:hypothetical protein
MSHQLHTSDGDQSGNENWARNHVFHQKIVTIQKSGNPVLGVAYFENPPRTESMVKAGIGDK